MKCQNIERGNRTQLATTVFLVLCAPWFVHGSEANSSPSSDAQYLDGWRMAGANPQRTSWVPEDVPGMLQLQWYRPFEPFISHKVQIIAADGLLFVATARGLYALDAQTGDERWVYPTALPLGHSPTVVDAVAYVGCFDRCLHAVDARTGQGLWTSPPAGGGFNTNPVVVDGRVYAGNRDGSLYAFDAKTGQTVWKFDTGLRQPILFSCAYQDGVLYFACNDMHAYAVDAKTGRQVWKSAKLPGAGFHSWWPVVYRDRVFLTGSDNYRDVGNNPPSRLQGLLRIEDEEIYGGDWSKSSGRAGLVRDDADCPWRSDAEHPTLDFSRKSADGRGPLTDYFEAKPWRRTVFQFDRKTGQEITYDFDRDGKPEHIPLLFLGTHSGNRYPPVVGGDGLLYQTAGGVLGRPWISLGGILRWKFDTPLFGVLTADAHDEPPALSAGGRQIYVYHGEYYDGFQGAADTKTGQLHTYYWYIDKIAPDIPAWVLQRPNQMYGVHCDQNPPIPYRGKVYSQKWNHVLCFSPQGGRQRLAPAAVRPAKPVAVPAREELRARLEAEVEKMLQAGHLRPGWFNRGLDSSNIEQQVTDNYDDYFSQPGQTLEVLCRALPHLSEEMQPRVKQCLRAEFEAFPPDKYAHMGWQGASRGADDVPPEMEAEIPGLGPRTGSSGRVGKYYAFPPNANYSLYVYARTMGNARELVGRLRKIDPVPPDQDLLKYPYIHQAFIAGFAGIVGLKELAGQPDAAAKTELERLIKLRVQSFAKDRPKFQMTDDMPEYVKERFKNPNTTPAQLEMCNAAIPLTIFRNFAYLTPQLAESLRSQAVDKVRAACRDYQEVHPYWFVARAEEGFQENVFCPLWDRHCLLQAKALILREPSEELAKYVDVPAFWRGDLDYIDSLCAALGADRALGAGLWKPIPQVTSAK